MSRWPQVGGMLGLIFLAGCLSLPSLRPPRSPGPLESIQAGRTTRKEVLKKLRRPNVLAHERLYIYEWPADARWWKEDEGDTTLRATVEFDARDLVSRFEVQRLPLAGVSGNWNAAGGAELAAGSLPGQCCLALAASSGEQVLAAGGPGEVIFLWAGAEKTPGKRLESQDRKGQIRGLDLSPEGSRLATAGQGSGVVIWDLAAARPLLTLPGSAGATCLAYSKDGRNLAAGDHRGRVGVWSVDGGQPILTWEFTREDVTEVAWSPDGRWLAAGTQDGRVGLFDVPARREVAGIQADRERRSPRAVAFSPAGNLLAVSDGAIIELWDLAAIEQRIKPSAIPDLNLVLAPRTLVLPRTWGRPFPGRPALAFSADGARLAAASPGVVSLWEPRQGALMMQFPQISTPVYDLTFLPGRPALALSLEGGLRLLPL